MRKPTLNKISSRLSQPAMGVTKGIISYDSDNLYPQRVEAIIANSISGTTSINLFGKFVEGRGFRDTYFYRAKINNRGLTNDKLLKLLVEDYAKHNDIALHFDFNLNGQITGVNYIPVSWLRLTSGDENEIALSKDWNKAKRDILYINPFSNDTEKVKKEIEKAGGVENYSGQIYWKAFEEGKYQLCHADPVLEDMIVEAQSKLLRFRNVATGFLASYMLTTDKMKVGNITEEEARDIEASRTQFYNDIVALQGVEGYGKILVVEKEFQEQQFELKKLDLQNSDGALEYSDAVSRDNITRCFSQPPSLAGIQVAGKLGSAKEIEEAKEFYDDITYSHRLYFEQVFELIYSNYYIDINPSKDYSIIPISEKNVETNIIASLGVSAFQSLTEVITNPDLTEKQKKGLLMLGGVNEEQVNNLLDSTNMLGVRTNNIDGDI